MIFRLLFMGLPLLYYGLKWVFRTYFNRLGDEQRDYLYRHFRYYRCLTPEERKVFDKRVAFYMHEKMWDARCDFELREEMRLLISAVAVKVTFGFNEFSLPFFKHILVYPRQYLSGISQRLHKGEVNLNGLIVLSWEDFKEGIKTDDDGISLGIHEFAHAVYFENLKDNEDYFFIDKPTLQHWYDMAALEREKHYETGDHFFREYAFTNKEEFWAVSAEYFFEKPSEFRRALPVYYECMVQTFKQDPEQIYARGEAPMLEVQTGLAA
jgi:MtfA peptidase